MAFLQLHLMNMIRSICMWWVATLGICCWQSAYAQLNNIPDSIRVEIEMERVPEKRCDKYLEYINRVASTSPDSAIVLDDMLVRYYEEQHFIYGIGRTKSLKAWHLCFQAKYEESLRLGHEALILQKNIADSLGIALTLNRIGITNLQFKRYGSAQHYILQALTRFSRLQDDKRMDMAYNNLGIIAAEERRFPESIRYYKQSLDIRIARKDPFWIAYAYYNIGSCYLEAEKVDSAKRYLLLAYKTFREKTPKHKVPAMVYVGLGQLYKKLEDYPLALQYTQTGLTEAEKVSHVEIIVEAKKLQSEVLFEMGRYKEAYSIHRAYEGIKTKLDSANNASHVAEIEEQYKNAENETKLAALTNEKLEAENKAQEFKLYMLAAMIVSLMLIFGVAVVLLRRNQKQQMQRSELNAKISEIRMVALRAQMNPHFIFNCINTAQHFIMNAQKETAYEYLANFARLLRLVLENSDKPFIPLEDELAQIRLYIELEEIRFINKFTWIIDVDPALESGVFEIPGMILQPLIENAIGHGLINRNDGEGRLSVSMVLLGDSIVCEILDNGVGREKALMLKSQKKISHRSTALPNINERVKMLQTEVNSTINIELIDLFEDGIASGTLAKVVLPYR